MAPYSETILFYRVSNCARETVDKIPKIWYSIDMETVIGRDQVKEILSGVGAEFFTCVFIKRSTGEVRTMNCRRGVVKHLKGGKCAYSFSEKSLLPVFDLQIKEYRVIPLENVLEIRAGGVIYIVRRGE